MNAMRRDTTSLCLALVAGLLLMSACAKDDTGQLLQQDAAIADGGADVTAGDTVSPDRDPADSAVGDQKLEEIQDSSGHEDAPVDAVPDVGTEDAPSDLQSDTSPADTGSADTGHPDTSIGDTTPQDQTSGDSGQGDQTSGDVLPGYRSCGLLNFCVLAQAGCCGTCGEPPYDSLTAIGSDKWSEFYSATCNESNPICPDCPSMQPNENYVAVCQQGTCNKYDARTSFFSECKTKNDCRAIWADCCNCGPRVIAVATTQVQAWRQAVCNPAADCAICTQVEPTNTVACKDKHCVLGN